MPAPPVAPRSPTAPPATNALPFDVLFQALPPSPAPRSGGAPFAPGTQHPSPSPGTGTRATASIARRNALAPGAAPAPGGWSGEIVRWLIGERFHRFLLPAIGLILLFSYYPAGLSFYYSLTNFSLRGVTEFTGLANYRAVLLEDTYFRTGLINMVIIVGSSILKTITVPLLVAELVFWLRNGVHQYVFRTLFVLPAVVPDLVFTLMWRQVYDPNTGLLNQLLGAMGLAQFRRAWLGDETTAIWAIVGVGFPFVSAFAFLIFFGGLLNINGEFFDAAKVDGARWWQRFLHMDLPLLRPQFRILLFFAVVGAVQGFAGVFILTRGGPGTATYVPALQMYLRIAEGDFGYASAVGVVLFALVMVLTLVILRFRRNEGAEGG